MSKKCRKSTISAFGVYKIGQFGAKVRISKDEVPGLKGKVLKADQLPMLFILALFSRTTFWSLSQRRQTLYRMGLLWIFSYFFCRLSSCDAGNFRLATLETFFWRRHCFSPYFTALFTHFTTFFTTFSPYFIYTFSPLFLPNFTPFP